MLPNFITDIGCFNTCILMLGVLYSPPAVAERLRVQVSRISMADYEALHYDKEKLREACEQKSTGPHKIFTDSLINHSCAAGHHRGGQ